MKVQADDLPSEWLQARPGCCRTGAGTTASDRLADKGPELETAAHRWRLAHPPRSVNAHSPHHLVQAARACLAFRCVIVGLAYGPVQAGTHQLLAQSLPATPDLPPCHRRLARVSLPGRPQAVDWLDVGLSSRSHSSFKLSLMKIVPLAFSPAIHRIPNKDLRRAFHDAVQAGWPRPD